MLTTSHVTTQITKINKHREFNTVNQQDVQKRATLTTKTEEQKQWKRFKAPEKHGHRLSENKHWLLFNSPG